jgi:hypothetical protein
VDLLDGSRHQHRHDRVSVPSNLVGLSRRVRVDGDEFRGQAGASLGSGVGAFVGRGPICTGEDVFRSPLRPGVETRGERRANATNLGTPGHRRRERGEHRFEFGFGASTSICRHSGTSRRAWRAGRAEALQEVAERCHGYQPRATERYW